MLSSRKYPFLLFVKFHRCLQVLVYLHFFISTVLLMAAVVALCVLLTEILVRVLKQKICG